MLAWISCCHPPPDIRVWMTQANPPVPGSWFNTMPPSGSEIVNVTLSPTAGLRLLTEIDPASSTSCTVSVTSCRTARRVGPLWMSVATTVYW